MAATRDISRYPHQISAKLFYINSCFARFSSRNELICHNNITKILLNNGSRETAVNYTFIRATQNKSQMNWCLDRTFANGKRWCWIWIESYSNIHRHTFERNRMQLTNLQIIFWQNTVDTKSRWSISWQTRIMPLQLNAARIWSCHLEPSFRWEIPEERDNAFSLEVLTYSRLLSFERPGWGPDLHFHSNFSFRFYPKRKKF